MTSLRSLCFCAVAGALLCPTAIIAQQSAIQAVPSVRITEPIDNNQLVTLHGNTSPFAIAQNDRGPVSADLAMPDLTLVLSRSPEQQAAFDEYVSSEYVPNSPNYHQWLTPTEIGERFGPSETDIATIVKWLASQGFTVTEVTRDRMAIRFSGTAGQAESAFHTQIHNLMVKAVPHIGNMTDPKIPAALAPVVVGIKALNNFLPRPMHRGGDKVEFDPQLGRWQRVANAASVSSTAASSSFTFASPMAKASAEALNSTGPHPLFGINVPASSTTSAYLEEDVTPWDFATIYNVTPLWNDSINGTGQTIAVAGTSDINLPDVTTFRSTFGLPAGLAPNEIDTNGLATECTSTSSTAVCGIDDLIENSIDVEWSGAVAPDAQIDLVVTGQNTAGTVDTIYDSAQYVVENLTAKILNLSYGECELGEGTAENVAYYDLWQSAAAEGISVFVSSGDSGSPSCDQGGDVAGVPYSAQYGLSVNGLASTPYNVAVGGTDFSWCEPTINSSGNFVGCPASSNSQGSPAYWNTTNNTSTEPYESAAGYVPEIPWNDTCENPILGAYLESYASYLGVPGVSNTEASCNFVQNYWEEIYEQSGVMLAPYVDTIGGSGGASNCVVNSEDTDPDDPTCSTGTTTVATANGSVALTNDGWQKPYWQSGVSGIPGDGVRDLPDVSFFAGDGALNSAYLVCISAIGSCSYSSTSENFAEEFGGTSFASPAMAGVMALINEKAGAAQGLPNTRLYQLAYEQGYANCSAEGPPSSSCYFHGIDEGTNAMPCDLGALIGGTEYNGETWVSSQEYPGVVSSNCTALNSGDTVGTLTSSSVVASGNPDGIAYNAATGYNMATGLGSLNVANVVNAWISDTGTATATITVTPSSTSIDTGQALSVTVTVSGSSTVPTGYVTLTSSSYNSGATALNGGSATIAISGNTLSARTDILTAAYSGDSVYASGIGTATVTVAQSTYSLTATTPSAVSPGSSAVSTITGQSSSTDYTGTVTLNSCSLTSSSVTNPTDPPTCSVTGTIIYSAGTPSGSGTAAVSTTSTTSESAYPTAADKGRGWADAAGGFALAFLVFLGIPARRRNWRPLLGLVVLLTALGSLSGCGGGGTATTTTTTQTSSGTYTFTISGTGNDLARTSASTTFTLTVN
jgi:subtilase family serine protease